MKTRWFVKGFVLVGLLLFFGLLNVRARRVAAADYPSILPGEVMEVENVSKDGVVFYFDKKYTVGKFVNGDYWVKGPVVITKITPNYDSEAERNGWEVNPVVAGGQGFNGSTNGGEEDGFDPSLIPALPYTARGIQSIVKTISTGKECPAIKTAVVLTVVKAIPEGNGARVFRPPYVGVKTKPFYTVDDIRTELLPNTYALVKNTPTIESLADTFSHVWLDHKGGTIGRFLRPENSMSYDQRQNSEALCGAVFRLMMTDSLEDKMPLLINYLQYGIDKVHMIIDGQTWPDDGGEQTTHLLPSAFTATMLNLKGVKAVLKKADFFHGTRWFHQNEDGFTLYGTGEEDGASEKQYWDYVSNKITSQAIGDPYHYIDGGRPLVENEQAILSDTHKGEILATLLMPELKNAWPVEEWKMMQSYVDRWVYFGTWTLPDPVAACDGKLENYGITWGPDAKTGLVIGGNGRFTAAHGLYRDADGKGQYKSAFTAAMWDAYRTKAFGAETTAPYAAIICPYDQSSVEGVTILQTTAYGIHGIASVQYYMDKTPLGEPVTSAQTMSPFAYELSVDFAKIDTGIHTLYVVVTDRKGNKYTSKDIDITCKNGATPKGLVPFVEVRPGVKLKVNQEAFFTAEGTTYPDTLKLGRACYSWDFGDGYTLAPKASPLLEDGGIATVHYFMEPGTFTVTMTVDIYDGVGEDHQTPIGEIIDSRKTQVTVSVMGEAPMEGYELQHAPFSARIAQFITAVIPESARTDGRNRLIVTLIGKNSGIRRTLLDATNLTADMKFLLDHSELPKDEYTLQAQLYDQSNHKLVGGLWEEYFTKAYDGIPEVGINEWNSFCVNGEPYFPVTPYMLNVSKFAQYENAVNTTYTVGFYNEAPNHNHSPEIWLDYVRESSKMGWMATGPGRGDFNDTNASARNISLKRIRDFVRAGKEEQALFLWDWMDEPNIGGRLKRVPPPVIGAWTYITHENDGQHPVASNCGTSDYYNYYESTGFSRRHSFFADVILFDQYPLEYREHASLFNKEEGVIAMWVNTIETHKANTNNMIPLGCYVEVCDIRDYRNTPAPTKSQVLMEAWLATIHGVKMINWFPYFETKTIQYEAMREFMSCINSFGKIILSEDLAEAEWITDDSNVRNNRVDTLTKKDGEDTYLFAVRLTEPEPMESETNHILAYDEDKTITTTFTIPNFVNGTASLLNAMGEVVETIPVRNGTFRDTYEKEEYAIYRISADSGSHEPVQGDMNGDGRVDLSDVTFVAMNVGKTSDSSGWSAVKKADMNADGKLSIMDIVMVARVSK